MSRTTTPITVTAILGDVHKAGRGTAAQLTVDYGTYDLPMTVFAFKGDAQGRLAALGHNPDRFRTVVRVTYHQSAKGYANVATATDIELVSMDYLPRPVPTFRQHLARYAHALADRIA